MQFLYTNLTNKKEDTIMPKITKKGNYKFSDDEVYSAYYHMAKFNLSMLKAFKKADKAGHPSFDENVTNIEEWNELIGKFILTFQRIVDGYTDSPIALALEKLRKEHPEYDKFKPIKLENGCYTYAPEKKKLSEQYITADVREAEKAYYSEIQKNLQLFAKYFTTIWD